jgi:hypothetical protein
MKNNLGRALLLGGTLHLFWWWVIGDRHWPRHLFPGSALLLFACLIGLRDLTKRARQESQGLALARFVAAAIVLLPWIVEVSESMRRVGEWDDQTPAALGAARAVDSFLEANPNALLVGCGRGNQRDIDYLLKAQVITENCLRFNQRAFEPGRPWILVRNWMWNYSGDSATDRFGRVCDRGQTLYSQASYRVTVCPSKEAFQQ